MSISNQMKNSRLIQKCIVPDDKVVIENQGPQT